ISVKGSASGGSFHLASSNYADASLIAFGLLANKSFDAWTSDSAITSEISSVNGDTISHLTTGVNAAVTDIYLKTGTETSVVLASGSLGTAGNRKITGLSSGTKYKVTMGSVIYYAKADGTLSMSASDAAALTGTEITGTELTELTNGTVYLVEVYSTGGSGNGSGNGSTGGGGSGGSSDNAAVVVGGQSQTAGTVKTTTQDGRTTTTVTISTDKLGDILKNADRGAAVTIPVPAGSNNASGMLDGQAVKDMENKDATLVLQTGSASYTLPASQIDIDSVSGKFGAAVSLSDIAVNVSISEPIGATVKNVEDSAASGGFSIAVPAVEFTVSCTYGGKTVNVSAFNSYVERMIAIPDGVDASKITTAIVVEADGLVRHVPTEVAMINGKYYAKINSLTNSVYTLIWNPVEFSDVKTHWAKDAVNNMGSRLVVNGVGDNHYEPKRSITRAEFAAIMVKALGLAPGTGTNGFGDVGSSAWYCPYIETATSYGIIKGYDKDTFGPNRTITREQAMTMIARAMELTGIEANLTDSEISSLLA
ncbi:MAG: S-layer homology domain-containing protein, partial [Eubacteriales bacterium]|nr:S-layer homology domain-containing protein [Eubacteriales bacterium]